MSWVQIISHVCITVLALVALALRTEHRLTRIETDVTWLKRKMGFNCKGGSDNEQDSKVDQS